MADDEYEELQDIPYADGGSTLGDVLFGNNEEPEDNECIPYKTVYEKRCPLKSNGNKIFIQNIPITVRISKFERNVTKHLLNPYLYTIEVSHGQFHWTIYKRYKHFLYLHQQLKLFQASLLIPFPSDNHRRNRQSIKEGRRNADESQSSSLPRFPLRAEILIGYDEVDQRSRELEEYLQKLLGIRLYRTHYETAQFLTASPLSFIAQLGVKSVEGLVKKQTGSTRRGCCCGLLECTGCLRFGHVVSDLCGCWRERWLVVKDTWLGYVRPRDSALRGVILFDHGFDISPSLYSSAIQVYNMQRRVVFKCRGRRKRSQWCKTIQNLANRQGFGFTQTNEHSSFAPVRSDTVASWYVDGASYMSAVADAIDAAEEEIFIADWWLSPEIYLKRPSLHGHDWRLDKVLETKAAKGVKVFVLLYKEVEMALGINSYYSKSRLAKCHNDNIKVLRHPDHANSGVFLWAHHEKIVCVDQNYAFLGGIDLCYGRWDDSEHRLVDIGGYLPSGENLSKKKITSSRPLGSRPRPIATLVKNSNSIGISTVSSFPRDSNGVENGGLAEIKTDEAEDIPLDYLQIQEEIEEVQPSAENIKGDSPEFQRKNIFRKLQDSVQESSKSLMNRITGDVEEMKEAIEPSVVTQQSQQLENVNPILDEKDGLSGFVKYWLGKDYCNFIVKDFHDLDSPYQDLVDRHTTPRMPWHDVGVMVHGAAARDVARHFIQRWNAAKLEKAKKVPCYPYLVPKSYESFNEPKPMGFAHQHRVSCQVLRSVSAWSAGFQDSEVWEESIHEAYITSISKAQYYIYLENQFFISLARQNPNVKNQVGEAICKRILRAHKESKKFRVFIVLPLLPGFEGEVGGPSGTALHAITHWNYASMCRGPDSLVARLVDQGVENPHDYVTFHGLRNHSLLNNEPISELIYVHSKLMIVDDSVVICGSANINDRSLLGKRDSEIAVIIKDEELMEGVMDGSAAAVGTYGSSLRKQIFSEHLGLLKPQEATLDISDPISDSFYHDVWRGTSTSNTQIFEEVFRCLPSDEVTSFKDLQSYHEQIPLLTSDHGGAAIKIAQIKGHLVDIPMNFLKDEVLTPNPKSVEGLMPTALWT